MASNAEPAAAKQPNHGSNVVSVISVNAKACVDAEPSSHIKRQDLGKINNAASSNLSSGESRTKPFNCDGIDKKARKAKETGISQRRLTDARQDEISKSLEVVEVDEVDAKGKSKKAAAENVRRPPHASKALPEKDVEEDRSIATPKKKTKKDERLAQRKKQRQERDREGTKTLGKRSELSPIIQPPLLNSEDANGEDANLPLPQNKSVDGQEIASRRIASEPLHNEPLGSTSIIHDLPLTNNYSWPSMALRQPTRSTSSTNANTLPPTGAMGLAFNVFPKDVKGLPTLRILGTTDPAGELQYKVYGTKFHCQWRVLVRHNAREPLGSKCEDEKPWGKWAEGEKWIKEDITIMRTHDDKSNQRAEDLSDRRFELPLDLFKEKKPNEDGSIDYRLPQQFRINVGIEPLFLADHPLGINWPENLSDTAKDAIRDGSARISQVRMRATAVVHSKNGSHVVECDIRTYLTDISTIPENMSAEACRTERTRCNEAFRTTQHLTPFKLAIAIEWPSWCKQPELARSVGGKDKSVALQQKEENGDGAEVEVPDSVWPQAPVDSTGSRAHMAALHIRALSQNTIIPAAESDMLAVSGTFLSTSQDGSTAPSVKNGGNSSHEESAEATARPAETITTTKDSAKASGTSQGGEDLFSTIENALDKSRPDDVEHNGSWTPGHDVPDVFTQSLEILTLSPVAADGPQVCDRPHANGDGMGLPVPASRLLGLQTAVKDGITKPTQGSAPIPQLGTIAHPAASASAHITGSPRHGKKKSFVPSVEMKPTGLRKGISTLQQGSVDAAKSVEIIDLVSSGDEATVLSTKATGKNGIPRSSRRVKRSQTGNPSVSSKHPPKQISGYPLPSKSLKRPFIPSPTKPSSAQNPSSAMLTHQTLKSIDQTFEPLAQMPSAASNLSSNREMPNPPDKYGHHSRKVLPSSNQVTLGPSAALRVSSEQRPPLVPCYWLMVNEKGAITTKKLKIAQCHICQVTFSEFCDLRDHLKSVDSHPDRSIRIRYDKDGKKCDIRVRLPLEGDPPFVEKIFNEDTQNSKLVSGRPRRRDKPSLLASSTPFVADASSATRRQSPQALQKCRASQASQLRPLSSANPATLHKRCKWSIITWDNAWIEENDDTSRCILCDKQFSSFEKLRSHLETDILHCGSSITIAYDPDSTDCRILADQLKGYSSSESSAADNDNGRDKLDYDDDGDEKKRWNSNRPTVCDPDDSTEPSAQDSRGKSREKSPNPQPRKKRRMTNDIEATVAYVAILAYDANSASSSNKAVVNLADGSEVGPPEGSGMSAPNKVQSSNAKCVSQMTSLALNTIESAGAWTGDTSRADTLSTGHSHQAAARNTQFAQQPIVAESSTEWHSAQPSHSKKAKRANGPCIECKAISSTCGWHHRLPHQKRPDDGAVWCKNCYARHYNRLERDGGPCFLCRKTRSKKWHHKLQDEERHADGRIFCSKCYYQKSARRKTIILPETNPVSASSEHEVAPSDET